MRTITKNFVMCIAMLLMAVSAWAGDVVVIKKVNGVVNNAAGTVQTKIAQDNGVCTLTVTPASGYYIDFITAEKTVDGGLAQSRGESPTINFLEVTPTDEDADPSGVTTWTFAMPSGDEYDVEVVANFKQCVNISNAVVTLAETEFIYNGEEQTPEITSVVVGDEILEASDYTAVYTNNLNAGTATITLTGQRTYTGTAVKTFTIARKTLTEEMAPDPEDFAWYLYAFGDPITIDEDLKLYDHEIGEEGVYLEYGEDYTIAYTNNINVGTATATITGVGNYVGSIDFQFDIVRDMSDQISFDPNLWASYYAEEDLEIPLGFAAYIVTEVADGAVEVEPIDYIPCHEGVLLTIDPEFGGLGEMAIDEMIIAEAYEGEPGDFEANLLKGCYEATAVESLTAEGQSIYVLYNDEFVKSTKGYIPAFRCYLEVDGLSTFAANSRMAIRVAGGDDMTGIETINNEQSVKNNGLYDLNGRRLNSTQLKKGLYIKNGKKVVIK